MKYALYEAMDTRDNRMMMWLHDRTNHRVATFCNKWAPSRIKHRTATACEAIVWQPDSVMITFAAMGNAKHVDAWEFQG